MGKREVVSVREMEGKIGAALAARRNADTFFLARTDGRSAKDVNEAIRRGKAYRDAGADGLYIEGLRSHAELKRVGKALAGTPLATTMMEGGGRMPWVSPAEIHEAGFAMIMYPTTLLFQITRTVERALSALKAGKPMAGEGVGGSRRLRGHRGPAELEGDRGEVRRGVIPSGTGRSPASPCGESIDT